MTNNKRRQFIILILSYAAAFIILCSFPKPAYCIETKVYFNNDWNLVSFSFTSDKLIAALRDKNIIILSLSPNGSLTDADRIIPGKGYWAYSETTTSVAIDDAKEDNDGIYSVPLKKGWNIIGNPYTLYRDLEDFTIDGVLISNSPKVIRGPYDYSNMRQYYGDQDYKPATMLYSNGGFILNVSEDCVLRIHKFSPLDFYVNMIVFKQYYGESDTPVEGKGLVVNTFVASPIRWDIDIVTPYVIYTHLGSENYHIQFLRVAHTNNNYSNRSCHLPNAFDIYGRKYWGDFEELDYTGDVSGLSDVYQDGSYSVIIEQANATTFSINFKLSGDFPSYLAITSPKHGTTIDSLTPTIEWKAAGAAAYKVKIKDVATDLYVYSPEDSLFTSSCTSCNVKAPESVYYSDAAPPLQIPKDILSFGKKYELQVDAVGPLTDNTRKGIRRIVSFSTPQE